MKNYSVEITETLQRVIDVDADSPDDAIEKVRKQYLNQEIVLDSSDYVDTDISLYCNS
ncbi:MAG: DpnD/PcfM family protein [Burkholderiales bacterium]